MWDVLVDGVQDLLLHLADGVTVQGLHLDLRALLVLRMDAVHHLDTRGHCEEGGGATGTFPAGSITIDRRGD